jgi:hypothetical protein
MCALRQNPTPELQLTLDRGDGVYRPGEVVGITVTIQPARDLKLRSGTLRVSGTEHFEIRSRVTNTASDGNTTQTDSYTWAQSELFALEETFLGETTLPLGATERFTFRAQLPPDALPTCRGEILHVAWQVEVKLDRPLAGDLNTSAIVRVLGLAPGGEAPSQAYGVSDEPQEAALALVLPGLTAVAGVPFSGHLRILPHKDFRAAEVRLELERTENVPLSEGYTKYNTYGLKLSGSTQFRAGQPQSFPFQAPLPPDAPPTLQAKHGTLTWTMKGILNRRLRRDTSVAQEFTVFTGRVAHRL